MSALIGVSVAKAIPIEYDIVAAPLAVSLAICVMAYTSTDHPVGCDGDGDGDGDGSYQYQLILESMMGIFLVVCLMALLSGMRQRRDGDGNGLGTLGCRYFMRWH